MADASKSSRGSLGPGSTHGTGWGNKTDAARVLESDNSNEEDNDPIRFDSGHSTDPYSSLSKFGSGATAGAGFGNKSDANAEQDLALDHERTRLNLSHDTSPYSGATGYGSGTTGGAGYGNKMQDVPDSMSGKMMEKMGGLLGKDDLAKKGRAKREEAGYKGAPSEVDHEGDT